LCSIIQIYLGTVKSHYVYIRCHIAMSVNYSNIFRNCQKSLCLYSLSYCYVCLLNLPLTHLHQPKNGSNSPISGMLGATKGLDIY